MKKILLLSLILLFFYPSCKKDSNDKDYNTLRITEGDLGGFKYAFSPNAGFWSTVNQTTRYVHLVFGATDNQTITGENILSLLFYETGTSQVQFPSPEGQWIQFGLNIEGEVRYYQEENAILTIESFTDAKFTGFLSGEFVNTSNSLEKIKVEMDISLDMKQI